MVEQAGAYTFSLGYSPQSKVIAIVMALDQEVAHTYMLMLTECGFARSLGFI